MMKNKFIAASANVKDLDEKIKGLPIVTEVKKNIELNCVMSNSFGFGGTNATLVFESL
jgi:3-oxoacyl-[acyl-carrier-protein] synthase-1